MPDPSTPNPSDPDPEATTNASETPADGEERPAAKKRLKLKRLVLDKSQVKPADSIPPGDEPPEAVPYSDEEEPEPEPKESLQKPSLQKPDPPEESIPGEREDLSVAGERETAPESFRPPSSIRRISLILLAAAIAASGMLVYMKTMDPLGVDLEPIRPREVALRSKQTPPPTAATDAAPDPPFQSAPFVESAPSLQQFIHAIRQQQLSVSSSPRGLFVNGIFIPEGATVNPGLGIRLSSVRNDARPPAAVFSGPDGTAYPVQVPD